MACATFIPRSNKRPIDSVEGIDPTGSGSPIQCKRAPRQDLGLSPADFDSPPRFGRSSPPQNRERGRISPKYVFHKTGSSSPSSSPALTPSASPKRLERVVQKRVSPDHEPRFSIQQAAELCKQEVAKLDQHLRQEYDQALQDKLAEQYQSFIQFAQDQLATNMQGPPPEVDMSYIG